MPGSQSNMSKSHVRERRLLFFRFHARTFLSNGPFRVYANSNLAERDVFFLRCFQEMDSLRAGLLVKDDFFFRYFHDVIELFTERSDFGLVFFDELLCDEMRTDFFRLRDEQ